MGIRTVLAGAALAAAALGAALGTAAPAAAQIYGHGFGYGYAPAAYGYGGWGGGWGGDPAAALHAREDRIGGWIRSARDSGRLSGWRAGDAWAQLGHVRDDERHARWTQGGRLYGDQLARLNDRLSLIADHLRLDGDSGPPRW